jgi:DNA-binding NtrC family response regulator
VDEHWDVLLVGHSPLPDELLALLESERDTCLLACEATQLSPQRVQAYLPATPDTTCLRHALGRALEISFLADENQQLRQALQARHGFGEIHTKDRATAQALDVARSVANTRANVLLAGESGTGKTLLARVLHEHSDRAAGPFVTVNCGSLPGNLLESELFGHLRGAFTGAHQDRQGRIQAAHGGTLFLDEINSASLDLQVKLLRVLQEHTVTPVGGNHEIAVDIRLISATNQDLESEIKNGRFREDLFYRIHVVSIEMPPLRQRMSDLTDLCAVFIDRFARDYGKSVRTLSAECLAVLAGHDWPGNIRQLENALERGVLMAQGDELLPEHLGNDILKAVGWNSGQPAPGSLSAGLAHLDHLPPLREALEHPEMAIITRALELCSGNRKDVAAMLDINRSTLFNKMRKYGLMDLRFQ